VYRVRMAFFSSGAPIPQTRRGIEKVDPAKAAANRRRLEEQKRKKDEAEAAEKAKAEAADKAARARAQAAADAATAVAAKRLAENKAKADAEAVRLLRGCSPSVLVSLTC
jgi:hypothetical protein